MTTDSALPAGRLASLDLFRGMTMFFLVAEQALVYEALGDLNLEGTMWGSLITQFHHHPWNGLRFWDLIQPFFMFIVGVAMPFSFGKRWDHGDSWGLTFRHVVYRCFILFLCGTGLYCVSAGHLVWELWNVLVQLSVTIMIAFLIMRLSISTQLAVSFALLLITTLAYRFWPIGEFRVAGDPFVASQNFGAWMDMILMGKLSRGHWVAINCIPTAAHTIWGVVAGLILKSAREPGQKVKILGIAGLIGLAVGYGIDWAGFEPIVKRICTISFVIASGGWCLLVLAFFYWLVDIKGLKGWTTFFSIVGMNSIFIYLFSETAGEEWLTAAVAVFVGGFLGYAGMSEASWGVVSAFVTLGLHWYLCYWLYKRRIFIRI